MRNYIVGLRHRAHGTRYLKVRATDTSDAIVKAENLVEGTAWETIYAGCY